MRFFVLYTFLLIPASGQPVSFGVLGGGLATGGLDPSAQNAWEGKRYTIGPTIEFHLPRHFSVEVDALYQRTGDSNSDCIFTYCSASSRRANILEFPVQLKFRLLR